MKGFDEVSDEGPRRPWLTLLLVVLLAIVLAIGLAIRLRADPLSSRSLISSTTSATPITGQSA